MTGLPVLRHVKTAHLVLRPRLEDEAAVFRQLWVERAEPGPHGVNITTVLEL